MKEINHKKGHSEEYFDSSRDYWWNSDFIDLMAKRWNLNNYSSLLDIGCGVCHWSKLLVPYLNKNASVCAVDSDEKWAKGSDEIRNYFANYNADIVFKTENAEELQIEENSFDVVTCQTVLMHLKDPQKAIREMYRVVKPGGIVICVEPNNLFLTLLNIRHQSIDEILDNVKYWFLYEKGKELSGKGNNSIGDFISEMLSIAGFNNIKVYISDKAIPMIPPYDEIEQKTIIDNILEWKTTNLADFDKKEQKKCIIAAGEEHLNFFEKCWQRSFKNSQKMIQAINDKKSLLSGYNSNKFNWIVSSIVNSCSLIS